jgi:obg-like ATPase 1
MTPDDYIRKKNKWLKKLVDWAKEHGNLALIPFSAALEQQLETMTAEQLKAWQEEHKSVSAIPKIVTTGFKSMNLIYFFTAGTDEVKAWTVTKGYRAPQAAGVIHTDFEKGFICADIYNYEDFVACGADEQKVKDAGKMRQQGKTYVVKVRLRVACSFF